MTISLDPKQTGHLKETEPLTTALTTRRIFDILHRPADPYYRINALRNWFNGNFYPAFELYLEDVWNNPIPGETRFEYILRSSKTGNESDVLGYDLYQNHQDEKGVWHLGDYVHTVIHIHDAQPLLAFIYANPSSLQSL